MTRSFEVGTRGFVVGTRGLTQTLATATWVDNYDDENYDEYNISGAGSIYGFETTDPIQGDASALRTDESGGYEVLLGDTGASTNLDNYPTKGDKFQIKIRSDSAGTNYVQMSMAFGVADADNFYFIRYEWEDDDFVLLNRSSGSNNSLDDERGVSSGNISAGDTLVMEVTWDDGTLGGSDNDITGKLYNADKTTEYSSITANDSSHATEEGVGMRSYVSVSNANATWDAYEIL